MKQPTTKADQLREAKFAGRRISSKSSKLAGLAADATARVEASAARKASRKAAKKARAK